jgi:hypothetical protein
MGEEADRPLLDAERTYEHFESGPSMKCAAVWSQVFAYRSLIMIAACSYRPSSFMMMRSFFSGSSMGRA